VYVDSKKSGILEVSTLLCHGGEGDDMLLKVLWINDGKDYIFDGLEEYCRSMTFTTR